MTLPSALSAPARLPSIEQAREAWWQFRSGNRLEEAERLWAAWLHWQMLAENQGRYAWDFLAWWADGQGNPGSLYNTLDRGRALACGYSGSLTELALRGRAMRNDLPRSETDALSVPELEARLRRKILSESESAADALAGYQGRTRELLAEADPQAPTAPTEADALNLSALEVLATVTPGVFRAAVQAAQTGDVGALLDLGEATKPPRKAEWMKLRGRCRICGRVAQGGEILDLHHERLGEREARPGDETPEILSGVHRACHIPQPFSDRQTAHSRLHTVGNDPARLVEALLHQAREDARYQAFIRGEKSIWDE